MVKNDGINFRNYSKEKENVDRNVPSRRSDEFFFEILLLW